MSDMLTLDAAECAAIAESLSYREEDEAYDVAVQSTGLTVPWREAISSRAYEFVVRLETGGRAYYQQVIKGRPIWPGYSSGITIGCGFDLGYHSAAQFAAEWKGRIAQANFDRLLPAIGFRTVEPNRAAKVVKAKQMVQALKDIVIGWEVAIAQFDEAKMPRLIGQLYGALDNLDRLHPHSRGALLSLVFNRGPGGFTASGDRYREMREIRRLMTSGKPADFRQIPAQLVSMRRIWGEASSLAKRRSEEAALFTQGLEEATLAASLAELEAAVSMQGVGEALAEDHSDVAVQSDTGGEDGEPEGGASVYAAAGPKLADVKWNPNDDEQPDYRHLPKLSGPVEFDLTPADLDALIEYNSFAPRDGRVVFALRGARIVGADKRENVDSVTIADQRPDHRAYRCVIGVYDRSARRLWAYKASTVSNAAAVLSGYQKAKSGVYEGNVLATGCYTYTVGTHRAGQPGEIRGVLRLANEATGASTVVVLRSVEDVVYDRYDFWHKCAPADNIHPGRRIDGFSSLGCLTLPGDYNRSTRTHTGLWADFRVALGMGKVFAGSDDGRRFSTILLTGQDAALAASLRVSGEIDDKAKAGAALRRIRFGSQGKAVARLQAGLGLAPDASQLVGPVTRMALIARQQTMLGWADGILSPEMEGKLGLKVL